MTSSNLTWIRLQSGTWHAWARGAPSSSCGTVGSGDLVLRPAREIAPEPPPPDRPERGHVCQTCRRLSGALPVEPDLNTIAAEWVGKIKLQARRHRIRLRSDDVEDLADYLTAVGSVRDPEALAVYEAIQALILRPHRARHGQKAWNTIPRLRELLQLIEPLRPGQLHQLTAALQTWRSVTGRALSEAGQFRPERVIEGLLSLPDPEPYIRRLHEKGMTPLGVMFHPNTMANAKKDAALRGLFWDGARGEDQVGEALAGVRVIGDDDED